MLASGIDSLTLAIDLSWPDERAFARLDALKEKAKDREAAEPAVLRVQSGAAAWEFAVRPHGSDGYAWLLQSSELSMKLGGWAESRQRPSAMVDIRSETLWTHGAEAAVGRVVALLTATGARVRHVKPSRIDLCADLLLGERDWRADLIDCFVTRARDISPHFQTRGLSGFSIGKGAVSARLYDKPKEISSKSRKFWMFDIWGLPSVPERHRIVRVEFQLRRDALRELGLNAWTDVREGLARLWAYCSQSWLRIVDDARLHHTQQTVLPWWSVVQGGFAGAQCASPLVREKAVGADLERLAAQVVGGLSSIVSLSFADDSPMPGSLDRRSFCQGALAEALKRAPVDDKEFTLRVARKRARYARSPEGFAGRTDTPGQKG